MLIVLAVINERISRAPLGEANVLSLRSANTATASLRNAEVDRSHGDAQITSVRGTLVSAPHP
ncbi:hypothetical protein ACU4GD_14885 [Cupriavidus basilensis]